jgi:hypothetical protein
MVSSRSRILVALLVALVGCQVTLISTYDPEIDKASTALQKEMDAYLTELQTTPDEAQADYEHKKGFYDDYLVSLRSVLVRAQSHPKNHITEKQLELMISNLESLRLAHQSGPLDAATLSTTRDLFNQSWRAIITLELAKKRGDG